MIILMRYDRCHEGRKHRAEGGAHPSWEGREVLPEYA